VVAVKPTPQIMPHAKLHARHGLALLIAEEQIPSNPITLEYVVGASKFPKGRDATAAPHSPLLLFHFVKRRCQQRIESTHSSPWNKALESLI
jgi:hypothetical protein